MKKSSFLLIILLIVGSISFLILTFNTKNEPKEEKKTNIKTEKNDIETQVKEQIKKMSLEEKIGQMLIISYSSSKMTDGLNTLLKTVKPGGFIFFKDNFTSFSETKAFIEAIQGSNDIPYFLSIDQEGGKVQRFNFLTDQNVTQIPSMKELGEKNDEELTYEVGKVIAKELRTIGINMNFAPVVDVVTNPNNNVIGSRSFGSDSNLVAKLGIFLAKGLEENGVIAVYKHFPGHGNTEVDSHYMLPVVTKTKEELLKSDIIPFKQAIESGANIIMIGHLAVPNITKDNTPASLSKEVIHDLLKSELDFDGLVITDALNMKAITDNYEPQEIYEKAINAGVDILLMPKDPNEAIHLIKESIKENKIKEKQIEESVKKILMLKYSKLSNESLEENVLGSLEHQCIIKKVTE